MITLVTTWIASHLMVLLAGSGGLLWREIVLLVRKDAGLIKALWGRLRGKAKALEARLEALEAKIK